MSDHYARSLTNPAKYLRLTPDGVQYRNGFTRGFVPLVHAGVSTTMTSITLRDHGQEVITIGNVPNPGGFANALRTAKNVTVPTATKRELSSSGEDPRNNLPDLNSDFQNVALLIPLIGFKYRHAFNIVSTRSDLLGPEQNFNYGDTVKEGQSLFTFRLKNPFLEALFSKKAYTSFDLKSPVSGRIISRHAYTPLQTRPENPKIQDYVAIQPNADEEIRTPRTYIGTFLEVSQHMLGHWKTIEERLKDDGSSCILTKNDMRKEMDRLWNHPPILVPVSDIQ